MRAGGATKTLAPVVVASPPVRGYAMVCRNVSRQQFRAIMIITSLLDTDLY